MSESAARFCIVPQFKIVDGRKGEESVKDEVGRGTAGGPDEPIAPAAVQRQLSGRRRPIMIDQLSAAAARLPGREGERREGGGEGVGGGGWKGRGLQVGVVRPGPADRSGTAPHRVGAGGP